MKTNIRVHKENGRFIIAARREDGLTMTAHAIDAGTAKALKCDILAKMDYLPRRHRAA